MQDLNDLKLDASGQPFTGHDADGNHYNNGHWISRSTYEIGTGPLETFYTLWRFSVGKGWSSQKYIQNLSQNKEEAYAKARKLIGIADYHLDEFDISQRRLYRTHHLDVRVLRFGKHRGENVDQLLVTDPDYLWYLAVKSTWVPSNLQDRDTLNYIRELFSDEINAFQKAQADKAAAQAAKDAARQDVPLALFDGKRHTITGTLLGTKSVESNYGTTTKMLVEHADGWKIWCTLPGNWTKVDGTGTCAERGDLVEFSVQPQISDRDPKFCFGSRPTKARVLRAAVPDTNEVEVA